MLMRSLRPKSSNRPVRRPSTPLVKYADFVTDCSGPRSTRPRAQIAGTPPGTRSNLGKSDVGATLIMYKYVLLKLILDKSLSFNYHKFLRRVGHKK